LFGQVGATIRSTSSQSAKSSRTVSIVYEGPARRISRSLTSTRSRSPKAASPSPGERGVAHVAFDTLQVRIARDGHFDEVVAPAGGGGAKCGNVTEVGRVEGPTEETDSPNVHAPTLDTD